MSHDRRIIAMAAAALLITGLSVSAQEQSFVVHDTKPVIMQGPYLTSMSETGATVVWTTDTPCHAKVMIRAVSGMMTEQDNAAHGLLPIGTVHAVHLTGLEPGGSYAYRAVATRVVRMKAYWPEKGLSTESPERTFTTFDRSKPAAAFVAITDTHEDAARVKELLAAAKPGGADFLVHLGDAFHGLESEEQIFDRWLGPAALAADGRVPLLFIRGNHEMRGAFARRLFDYVPAPEGRYYFARDHGPMHLIVLDTGEDKDDDTNVYARLNRLEPYRETELAWLADHLATEPRAAAAPFRVILMHQPNWGWTGDRGAAWTGLANRHRIDLAIAGHFHRPQIIEPGKSGNDFPVLVLGQDQAARVEATAAGLRVTIIGRDGAETEALLLTPRR